MYAAQSETKTRKPVTISRLRQMKAEGEKIACLTAYDFSFGSLLDRAGVDVVLVGDSLGNVIQGRDTTIPVTVEDIIYHTRCVAAGRENALLMADMPFMSYVSAEDALHNAGRLMKEGGAHMVKLEAAGDQADLVGKMARAGIPVCAHLGLQPQLVHKIGGYRVQGREENAAQAMFEDAQLLERAGADLLLLELVPASLGKRISEALSIPVIGIGAGVDCDGQILVLHDMIGVTQGKRPKFSQDFMQGQSSITAAIEAYVGAVKHREFPGQAHSFF